MSVFELIIIFVILAIFLMPIPIVLFVVYKTKRAQPTPPTLGAKIQDKAEFPEDTPEGTTAPGTCPECNTISPTASNFCSMCGHPLS
jgi:hypothetical protein